MSPYAPRGYTEKNIIRALPYKVRAKDKPIRSLQQFVVQQLPNEKVSEPYEMSINFRIIIT